METHLCHRHLAHTPIHNTIHTHQAHALLLRGGVLANLMLCGMRALRFAMQGSVRRCSGFLSRLVAEVATHLSICACVHMLSVSQVLISTCS
jgi:hypothetical protein